MTKSVKSSLSKSVKKHPTLAIVGRKWSELREMVGTLVFCTEKFQFILNYGKINRYLKETLQIQFYLISDKKPCNSIVSRIPKTTARRIGEQNSPNIFVS